MDNAICLVVMPPGMPDEAAIAPNAEHCSPADPAPDGWQTVILQAENAPQSPALTIAIPPYYERRDQPEMPEQGGALWGAATMWCWAAAPSQSESGRNRAALSVWFATSGGFATSGAPMGSVLENLHECVAVLGDRRFNQCTFEVRFPDSTLRYFAVATWDLGGNVWMKAMLHSAELPELQVGLAVLRSVR